MSLNLWQSTVKIFVILACTVLTVAECDGQTNRQDRQKHHIFRGYPWIYPWISIDIYISTDVYRASIATKFSRNTAVPERSFLHALFVKLLKTNKSKK